jgi:phage terminase large subunit
MKYQQTTALKKILELKKRTRIVQGGARAGKTIAILLILIHIAQSHKNKVISVVSETMPHLRKGAMRDFLDIMNVQKYFKDTRWKQSPEYVYTFETGSIIEFFSADDSDKVRGPTRDILFINECNNVPFETYRQLIIRTTDVIYLDYNPVQEFWVHTEILPKDTGDYDFIILTYKDNEYLAKQIVLELESRKSNKYFWKVYGEGQLGEAEGRIYTGWATIDNIPHEARLERYGLDFGYSNDPTAIVALYYYNGGYIVDEITYQKGLSNRQIADVFINQKKELIIADSAEPKSIDELKSYGLNVLPCKKGKDSVMQGIQFVQDQKVSVTKRSLNVLKEYRNYLWQVDRDGKIINKPEVGFGHSMDAIRYGLDSFKPQLDDDDIISEIPVEEWKTKKYY